MEIVTFAATAGACLDPTCSDPRRRGRSLRRKIAWIVSASYLAGPFC
jgi:hypothetical protein